MSIHDIENMTFAELKAQRAELVKEAETLDRKDVAARYIQARTDATQRDEKLAEQARILESLQTGLEASKQQAEAFEKKLTEDVGAMKAEAAAYVEAKKSELDLRDQELEDMRTSRARLEAAVEKRQNEDLRRYTDLTVFCKQEITRADRLKTVATCHHIAVSSAAKLLNDALAAKAVDHADTGA